jgi:hypothetical protein
LVIVTLVAALGATCGCAPRRATPTAKLPDSSLSPRSTNAPTTRPILYHRKGGIAGTDDRVVIWPDGFVQVDGRLMTPSVSRVPAERLKHLADMFRDWQKLDDAYLASNIPDAYQITIDYGGKAVEASDLAPNLPPQFRQIFAEIEAIAAQSANVEPKPAGAP